MSADEPTLLDAARALEVLSPVDGPWPAIVNSYDPDTGQATVTPTPGVSDKKSGKAYELGPIEVPVVWFGSASVVIDTELVEGDEVFLIPCTPSIRQWLQSGGKQTGRGPGKRLGESVAFPVRLSGPRRPGAPGVRLRVGAASGTGAVLINVDAGGEVRVQAASVSLGAELSPKLAVARDTDPVIIGAAYATFVSQVTGVLNTAGPVVGAPGTITPVLTSTVGTVAATSTEVESS